MSESRRYGRALLKISGEALAGDRDFGFDHRQVSEIAREISAASRLGVELVIVIGGGNIFRGAAGSSLGVPPLVGDHIGMVATVLNAMVLRSALEAVGVSARTMSAFPVGKFVEPFERETALKYVREGQVVIFAGGTGNPCFTTDSAAALRAVEIEAEVVIKATQVRGVFDKDPRKHPDAVFFESISHQEVLRRGLKVMDAASVEILSRENIPTIVLDLHVPGNIAGALRGERIGTLIS
jgi:uridylate kinase